MSADDSGNDKQHTLREFLNVTFFCHTNVTIALSWRPNRQTEWAKIQGHYLDDHILRYMCCDLVSVKYVIGCPLQVAVEGKPYDWGT